jgi:hypothetical protein
MNAHVVRKEIGSDRAHSALGAPIDRLRARFGTVIRTEPISPTVPPPTAPNPTASEPTDDIISNSAQSALADAEARCQGKFRSAAWRAAWNERHISPQGHEAARRGVEACLEAGRQSLERGEISAVHALTALALRVADGVEFDRGRQWTATERAIDISTG